MWLYFKSKQTLIIMKIEFDKLHTFINSLT